MTENGVPDARITGKLFDIYRPEAGFSTGCSPVSAQVFMDLSSLVKTVLCVIGLFLWIDLLFRTGISRFMFEVSPERGRASLRSCPVNRWSVLIRLPSEKQPFSMDFS